MIFFECIKPKILCNTKQQINNKQLTNVFDDLIYNDNQLLIDEIINVVDPITKLTRVDINDIVRTDIKYIISQHIDDEKIDISKMYNLDDYNIDKTNDVLLYTDNLNSNEVCMKIDMLSARFERVFIIRSNLQKINDHKFYIYCYKFSNKINENVLPTNIRYILDILYTYYTYADYVINLAYKFVNNINNVNSMKCIKLGINAEYKLFVQSIIYRLKLLKIDIK